MACAAERQSEIVRAWAGLGYNRRALHLHRCAATVTADHGGALPDDLDALQALPGVGPYTARAVLAFAFGRDVGVLDTNAARVIARAVAGRPLDRPALQRAADDAVPAGRGWEWNQAVLDLGADVCTARRPRCGACPLESLCAWRSVGGPDPAARRGSTPAFEGSDRQARGRLLEALRRGPVADAALACGCPGDRERTARIVDGVVSDGFAIRRDGLLVLREG